MPDEEFVQEFHDAVMEEAAEKGVISEEEAKSMKKEKSEGKTLTMQLVTKNVQKARGIYAQKSKRELEDILRTKTHQIIPEVDPQRAQDLLTEIKVICECLRRNDVSPLAIVFNEVRGEVQKVTNAINEVAAEQSEDAPGE